jgi:hypothetical protein
VAFGSDEFERMRRDSACPTPASTDTHPREQHESPGTTASKGERVKLPIALTGPTGLAALFTFVLLGTVGAAKAHATACGAPSFAAARTYAAGSSPTAVVVADFNGDARLDMAVANQSSANVSVLLGNGDGTLQAAVQYFADAVPRALAVGDFNGDSKPDLAATNFGSGVAVLLGNGDGTFAAAVEYGAGTVPLSIAVADFNGDSKADLVVANAYSDNVSILLGNGNGTFRDAVNY